MTTAIEGLTPEIMQDISNNLGALASKVNKVDEISKSLESVSELSEDLKIVKDKIAEESSKRQNLEQLLMQGKNELAIAAKKDPESETALKQMFLNAVLLEEADRLEMFKEIGDVENLKMQFNSFYETGMIKADTIMGQECYYEPQHLYPLYNKVKVDSLTVHITRKIVDTLNLLPIDDVCSDGCNTVEVPLPFTQREKTLTLFQSVFTTCPMDANIRRLFKYNNDIVTDLLRAAYDLRERSLIYGDSFGWLRHTLNGDGFFKMASARKGIISLEDITNALSYVGNFNSAGNFTLVLHPFVYAYLENAVRANYSGTNLNGLDMLFKGAKIMGQASINTVVRTSEMPDPTRSQSGEVYEAGKIPSGAVLFAIVDFNKGYTAYEWMKPEVKWSTNNAFCEQANLHVNFGGEIACKNAGIVVVGK